MGLHSRGVFQVEGITSLQWHLLCEVRERPAIQASALCERLCAQPNTLSTALRQLLKRSLIVRRASTLDRRRFELKITRAGVSLLGRIEEKASRQLQTALRALSPAEVQEFSSLLAKLVEDEPARRGLLLQPRIEMKQPTGEGDLGLARRFLIAELSKSEPAVRLPPYLLHPSHFVMVLLRDSQPVGLVEIRRSGDMGELVNLVFQKISSIAGLKKEFIEKSLKIYFEMEDVGRIRVPPELISETGKRIVKFDSSRNAEILRSAR
jgi:DNA-binding MarR family transcriptional regulator